MPPAAPADRVIGQIDFTKNAANFVDGRGLYFPSAVAVDPVGGEIYVADTSNNRVLGWKSAAEFQGNQPADIVIGQPDFNSYYCNQTLGVVSPQGSAVPPAENTLCWPEGVAVDQSGNVYVSDAGNNRVLVYSNPFALLPGQNSNFNAMMVFGQGSAGNSFTTNAAATGQAGLAFPAALAVDSSSNLFVLDSQNNRALEYFDPLGAADPITGAGDVVADRVFGQTDFSGNLQNQGGTATDQTLDTASYGGPTGLAVDSFGNLYVGDNGNSRALEFKGPFVSVANDPAANLVFPGFGVFSVTGIAVDPSNRLYIAAADSYNNRLIFRFDETTNPPSNTTPNLTLGPSLNIANRPHAFLGSELGLASDRAGDLYAADAYSNRVIEYFAPGGTPGSSPGSAGDTTPDQVLGQLQFDERSVNFPDGRSLNEPGAVAIDRSANPNHIYVLDSMNNRVLGWNSLSGFTGNQPADLVVGQNDFSSSMCDGHITAPSAQSLCLLGEGGITVDGHGNLFVADSYNSRVLEFSDPFASLQAAGKTSGFSAVTVFGQDGIFTTAYCNEGGSPSASTLCMPAGVAFDPGGNLYVADPGNSRVLEFAPDASGSFGPTPMPTAVFGQGGSYTQQTCANGDASGPHSSPKPTPAPDNLCGWNGSDPPRLGVTTDASGNLYIADVFNNRVLQFTPAFPGSFGSDPVASLVFGQGASGSNFNSNLCGATTSATSFCLPSGVATDLSGNLYIADSNNSRVLEYDEPTQPTSNVIADRVFGQSDTVTSVCNSAEPGDLASAASLCQPRGLASDALGHLYVADTANNRVLEYDQPLAPTPTPSPTPMPTPVPTPTPTPVPKNLHFGPNPVDFPNTVLGAIGATSAPVQVHLKNRDTSPTFPITLEATKLAGPNPGDFAIASSTCSSVIPPGSKCFLNLTFTPTALGLRTAKLKIFDNAHNSPQVFYLRGYGVRGKLGLSTTAIYFGKVAKGQASASHNLTLINPNPVALSIGKVGVFTTSGETVNQFAKVYDGCSNTQLAAGAQCTISVTFVPTGIGVMTGDIRIHDDARHHPQNVYLQGTANVACPSSTEILSPCVMIK